MFKIVLVIFSFLIVSIDVASQANLTDYFKGEEVKHLFVDENKNLYLKASDTTFLFDGLNFLHVKKPFVEDSELIESMEEHLQIIDDYNLRGTVTTAAILTDGRFIFTNKTSRLYQRYNDKVLRYLIPDLEEQSLIINKLISADEYLLICTLNDGLYIWKHKEFVLDKLNYSQGIASNNINDALLDDWGNLWIATDFGLKKMIYIDKSDTSYPAVSIDKINLMYDEVETQDISILEESENSLQFHYSARDYSGSDHLSYEWRLDDNNQWVIEHEEVVSLSAIEPGRYKFQIRATNGNGLYGYADPINFKIKSSSLSAVWKYVFGGLGLLGLLWLWSLSRYNKSVKSFKAEKKKLKLENELLKTEQKALQLQMNPHFVFNALNSIQGLIALNDNKAARKYLNKFATMMRSVLDQSRGEAIYLDDEIKYLDDYLSLEQMGKEGKFEFEIVKSKSISESKIPSMLIQPFVENAIIHGMKGLNKKGKIDIHFSMDDDRLICEIEDNGVGRDQSKPNHKSLGMTVVTDRLSKYSKFKNYKNISITDKKNKDGSSAGTKILINLPQL